MAPVAEGKFDGEVPAAVPAARSPWRRSTRRRAGPSSPVTPSSPPPLEEHAEDRHSPSKFTACVAKPRSDLAEFPERVERSPNQRDGFALIRRVDLGRHILLVALKLIPDDEGRYIISGTYKISRHDIETRVRKGYAKPRLGQQKAPESGAFSSTLMAGSQRSRISFGFRLLTPPKAECVEEEFSPHQRCRGYHTDFIRIFNFRYQTFTRFSGGRYSASPGLIPNASYQASRLRTVRAR